MKLYPWQIELLRWIKGGNEPFRDFRQHYAGMQEDTAWKKPGATGHYIHPSTKKKLPCRILAIAHEEGQNQRAWCEIFTITGDIRNQWLALGDIIK